MKEEQKKLITEIMNADAKDGLYKQTAVEWLYEISKQREPDKFDWEKAKEREKWQRMKFEIPELSDDEIIKELFGKWYDPNNDAHYNLIEGARWYREQLKQRQ